MSDFKKAFARTMGNEGGWVNNPADSGGETYRGISRANWPRWSGWPGVDATKGTLLKQPPFGTTEYRNWVKFLDGRLAANSLLCAAVASFYKQNFWGALGDVFDQRVAEEVFDKRVNCGDVASHWLQRVAGVVADGIIGPATVTAVNAADPATLLGEFNAAARHYYEAIVAREPSQAQFLHVWLSRLKNYDDTPFAAEETST